MNLIWVIRELCSGEDGFEGLFDKDASFERLMELSDNKQEAGQFAVLIYGPTREVLLELINDAYNYRAYAEKIKGDLHNRGLSEAAAKRTLEIFFEAFGFPGHRHCDPSRFGVVITESDDFRTEYKGEVKDGKEHGVGVRTCYFEGKECNYDECVWVNGVMCGYNSSKEVEFGMFEDKKIGFVANDYFIGKIRVFPADGEEYNDLGKKLDIE